MSTKYRPTLILPLDAEERIADAARARHLKPQEFLRSTILAALDAPTAAPSPAVIKSLHSLARHLAEAAKDVQILLDACEGEHGNTTAFMPEINAVIDRATSYIEKETGGNPAASADAAGDGGEDRAGARPDRAKRSRGDKVAP